jgi:hypothetical protein
MVRAPLRQVRCQGCCWMRPDCTWTDPFIALCWDASTLERLLLVNAR